MSDDQLEKIIERTVKKVVKKYLPKDLYLLGEAAQRLSVSPNRIWRDFVLTGKLGVVKDGQRWKVPAEEISKYIAENKLYYLPAFAKATADIPALNKAG